MNVAVGRMSERMTSGRLVGPAELRNSSRESAALYQDDRDRCGSRPIWRAELFSEERERDAP